MRTAWVTLRVQHDEGLRREAAERPPADHQLSQVQRLDQVVRVTRQRQRIVVLLSGREAEAAVVERDDTKPNGGKTIQEQRVPQVQVASEAGAEHERLARPSDRYARQRPFTSTYWVRTTNRQRWIRCRPSVAPSEVRCRCSELRPVFDSDDAHGNFTFSRYIWQLPRLFDEPLLRSVDAEQHFEPPPDAGWDPIRLLAGRRFRPEVDVH